MCQRFENQIDVILATLAEFLIKRVLKSERFCFSQKHRFSVHIASIHRSVSSCL